MLGPQMDKRVLLLTRPRDSAERFAARLSQLALQDVSLCYSPLLEIVSTGEAPNISQFDGVIFTSARAIECAPVLSRGVAFCVGEQTARTATGAGWQVKLVAQTADELVTAIRKAGVKGRFVHLAGAHRRGQIAARLTRSGMQVDVITLYEQHLRPLSDAAREVLAGEVPVIVPLFSPRTAAQFGDQAQDLTRVSVAAISPAVAEAIQGKSPKALHIAEAPTGEEMARTVEMLLRKDRLP
jgi:uroporphyrinogen-III synthase